MANKWSEGLDFGESPPSTGDWWGKLQEDLAGQVSSDIEIDTDPQNQGLQSGFARGQMALLADTAAESREVLRKYYPKGEIVRKDNELYFNTKPGEKFRKVDPSMISDEGRLKDLPYDIADVAGALPVVAAELIAFGLTKNPTALGNTLIAGGAGMAGEAARQTTQSIAGTQRKTGAQIAGQIGTEGVLSAGGEALAKPAIAGANALKQGANIALQKGAKEAQRAAQRIGLPPHTPGQIAQSPLIRVLEAQSRALSTTFDKRVAEQKESAMSALRRVGLSDPSKSPSRYIATVKGAANKLISRMKHQPRTTIKAGEALQKGVEEWDEMANAGVRAAYDHARSLGTPSYDLSNVRAVAKDVKLGRRGIAAEETTDVDTGIVDELGNPITRQETTQGTVSVDPPLEAELSRVIDSIERLDPSLPPWEIDGKEVDATDQLAGLRTQLWELKTPQPGEEARFVHWRAGRLYNALTDAMSNPRLDNEGASAAWKESAQLAKQRFDIWDKAVVSHISRTQTPSALAASLFAPNKVDDLTFLKEILPPERWKTFKDFAGGRIVDNPKLLDSIDPETMGSVFSVREIEAYKDLTDNLAKLRAPELESVAQKGFANRKFIREHLSNPTPAQSEAIIKAVKDNPAAHADVKAALIDEAVEKALNSKMAHESLGNTMKAWRDNGLMNIFSFKDQRTLKGLQSYMRFSEASIDSGTRLVTAGAIGGIKRFDLAAVGVILHSVGIGKVMMSKSFGKFLMGQGGRQRNFGGVRALSAAIGASLNDPVIREDLEKSE